MSLFGDFSMTRIFFLGVLVLSGCGDADGPRMADVAGTITFGGEPLAGAEVHFVSGEVEGYGRTNAEGSYTLVRGAPVGKCSVYITKAPDTKFAQSIDITIEGMDAGQVEAMTASAAGRDMSPLLPLEYSDPSQSKLTFDVPDGGAGDADFKL
jgi:hypothetical protein